MTNKANRQTLKQRAQAIIDNPGRYDPDTRHAVRNVLEEKASDLAEFVRRAERGDTILDLVKPLEAEPEQAAMADGAEQPYDILRRMQDAISATFEYLPITHMQAAELADRIAHYDDDEVAYALIKLLHGIADAYFKKGDVEGLVLYAAHRAYSKTMHFSEGFQEFASLDSDNARDRRVIRRQFLDDETAK